MGHLDPIAYTYEADHHCPECALERFGRNAHGTVPESAEDNEGNPVGAVMPWEEWFDIGLDACEVLTCGTCMGEIDRAHLGGFQGSDECTCALETG